MINSQSFHCILSHLAFIDRETFLLQPSINTASSFLLLAFVHLQIDNVPTGGWKHIYAFTGQEHKYQHHQYAVRFMLWCVMKYSKLGLSPNSLFQNPGLSTCTSYSIFCSVNCRAGYYFKFFDVNTSIKCLTCVTDTKTISF